METETSHVSVKAYLLVFGGLAMLTGLTVALSYAGFPRRIAICLAGLIALTKCSLIAAFFMHLKLEKKAIYAILITALFLVGALVSALVPDIGIIR